MKPVQFSRFAQVIRAHDPSIAAVHILTNRYQDGTPESITCWQLSWRERLIVLLGGKIFVHQLGNQPVPIKPSVDFAHIKTIEQWYEIKGDND